ncbi:MAG: hypothetical protein AVDCRST_MAG09-1401, partial [uncultured Sphingomonas sp.]
AVQASGRTVRCRLVPLPNLPAQQRLAGDGVRKCRRWRLGSYGGCRKHRHRPIQQLRPSRFLCRVRNSALHAGRPPAGNRRLQHRDARQPRSGEARLSHLLGEPPAVVSGGRAADIRAVQAEHAGTRRARAPERVL